MRLSCAVFGALWAVLEPFLPIWHPRRSVRPQDTPKRPPEAPERPLRGPKRPPRGIIVMTRIIVIIVII